VRVAARGLNAIRAEQCGSSVCQVARHVASQTGQPTDLGCMLLERRWSVMGKAEDKRAAIVAAQAAREAGERAARGVSTSARPARKEKPKWAMRRGRPPKSPE
jgi:hypothetical protein